MIPLVSNSVLDLARDRAAAFLRELPDRHVGAQTTREELFAALHAPLSDDGEDSAAVIDALARGADRGLIAVAGPRYFGFVIGGSLPVALAADWLTSAWDQNAGIYATSPAASVVEDIAREWLLELFDLPRTSSVGFVTGGQMANFTALAAARHGVLRGAGWNIEEDGLADSWANDAHKWLNVPYDSGIVIVRDSASHRAAMTLSAEYLQQTTGVERDNFDWVPEFSRRARAFPIYAAIRALGRRGIAALIDGCCDRARQFAEILGRDKRVAILNDVVLNQVLVRFSDS